jgi:hypothetical protein
MGGLSEEEANLLIFTGYLISMKIPWKPLQNPSRRSHPFANEVCGLGFVACSPRDRLQNLPGIPHPGKARSSTSGFAEVPLHE